MFVNNLILASNPFFNSYISSDALGKLIFLGLLALSIVTWVILFHKIWLTYRIKNNSAQFNDLLKEHKGNILALECTDNNTPLNSFLLLYQVLKKQTVDILNKNRRFGSAEGGASLTPCLSAADISVVESHLATAVALQTKFLEKNLFILATVVSLAPFLGLLGTVWGILTTFSHLQDHAAGNTNQMVLSGLSLALATTVLGLVDAIPALIGYNYLKNSVRDFQTEMECFSNDILVAVEMQYRKVDAH